MRDRYIILSVLLIVCFLAPVDAYTNHSLEWGVESGVKYWYSADFYKTTDEDLDGEIDEVIDLNVNYYGMIEQGFPYDVRDNVTLMQDECINFRVLIHCRHESDCVFLRFNPIFVKVKAFKSSSRL